MADFAPVETIVRVHPKVMWAKFEALAADPPRHSRALEPGGVMNDIELIASYWTLSGGALPHTDAEHSTFEFKERCAAAARAGFKGIGLWHADLEHVLESYTLPQMKRILDDNGLEHIEIEFLADWFLPAGERRAASDERRAFLFTCCEGLGARHLSPPFRGICGSRPSGASSRPHSRRRPWRGAPAAGYRSRTR